MQFCSKTEAKKACFWIILELEGYDFGVTLQDAKLNMKALKLMVFEIKLMSFCIVGEKMRKKINANDFAQRFSNEFKVAKAESSLQCDRVFKLLNQILHTEDSDISIQHFGTFRHKKAAAKKFRHPKSGEMGELPERNIIKFVASENPIDLKERPVN